MKTNRLLLVISIVSFITVSFVSCSEDGMMGIGETGTGTPPPPPAMTKSAEALQIDSIAGTPFLPND